MKTVLIVLLGCAIFYAVILFYRSGHTGRDLNVDPHTRQEIEKAKKR
jgi:hypothetical protein